MDQTLCFRNNKISNYIRLTYRTVCIGVYTVSFWMAMATKKKKKISVRLSMGEFDQLLFIFSYDRYCVCVWG